MLSRALSLATVTLLIGGFAADPACAAQNLEAGKSPSQIFAGTCTACHKGPRGLLRTVPAGSLPGFLRQHYTTSRDMASLLSAFLVSNGAADTRYRRPAQAGQGRKSEAGPAARPISSTGLAAGCAARRTAPGGSPPGGDARIRSRAQSQRPDAMAATPSRRRGRCEGNDRLPGRQSERGPDGRRLSAKQRLSKRGKPGEERKDGRAKPDAGKAEAAKTEAAKSERRKNEASRARRPQRRRLQGNREERASESRAASPSSKLPAGDAKSGARQARDRPKARAKLPTLPRAA